MPDVPLHGLATEDTSPLVTDFVYVEHDPLGTPAPRKVQVGNMPYPLIYNGGEDGLETASISGAVTVNMALGNNKAYTLTGAVTLTLPTTLTSGVLNVLTIRAHQNATGGWVITWPASVLWMPGSSPLSVATANRDDVYQLITEDGGTNWFGYHITQVLASQTKTADYTLVKNDAWTRIEMNAAGANTVTFPSKQNVPWYIGSEIVFFERGAGQTTFAGGAIPGGGNVTLTALAGHTKISAQNGSVSALYIGGDEWVLAGDMA